MRRVLFLTSLVCLAVSTAMAQDPVKVDPKHHKVEFENTQVCVLRINYGPHEQRTLLAVPVLSFAGEENRLAQAVFYSVFEKRRARPWGQWRKTEGAIGSTPRTNSAERRSAASCRESQEKP